MFNQDSKIAENADGVKNFSDVALSVISENIPSELKALPQWVVWKYTFDKKKNKWTKPPYQVSGQAAKSTDASTWTDFETAFEHYNFNKDVDCDGIGFVLADNGIVGFDFDHCLDKITGNIIDPKVTEFLKKLDSYTEKSPSSTGVRVFVYGKLPEGGRKKGNYECYEIQRYLTLTGHSFKGFSVKIEHRESELSEVYETIFEKSEKPKGAAFPEADIEKYLMKARNAKNGEQFKALYDEGNWKEAGYPSESEADLSLCSKLAFWLDRNPDAMNFAFRQSELYRSKWDEKHGDKTYGDLTIAKAIEKCKQTYQNGRSDEENPELILRNGYLHKEVYFCQDVIRKAGEIYERGGELVRAVSVKELKSDKKVYRDPNSFVLQRITPEWLKLYLNEKVNFYRLKESKKIKTELQPNQIKGEDGTVYDKIPMNCNSELVKSICANAGAWDCRYIAGLLETPTITEVGRIISKSGYDDETELLVTSDMKINVKEQPTKEDVKKSQAIIQEILSEFPFETDVDYAVAFSAILTGIVRRVIPTSPFFAFDATKPGSGKSLLADCISLVSTGKKPATLNMPPNDDKEAEKRYDSVLMAGDPVILIDNIQHTVKSDRLCSIATQTVIDSRILGFSKILKMPSNSLWLFTGNNISFAGDITRRVLKSRIDPRCENPEERTFKKDVKRFVIENRKVIVESVLTILKAFIQEKNKPVVTPLGSFEEWSNLVRRAVIWLGLSDPVEAKKNVQNEDSDRKRLCGLLELWKDNFGEKAFTVKEAVKSGKEDLESFLSEQFSKDGINTNPRSIGNFIAKHRGNIEKGLSFFQDGDLRRAAKWKVLTHTKQEPENTKESSHSVSSCELVPPYCDLKKGEGKTSEEKRSVGGYGETHTNSHKKDNDVEIQQKLSVSYADVTCVKCPLSKSACSHAEQVDKMFFCNHGGGCQLVERITLCPALPN